MKKLKLMLLLASISCLSQAEAGVLTAFQSGANLNATCEITNIPNLSFGEIKVNPVNPSEFGLNSGQHSFPITFKCSPYTVATVTVAVATPEKIGDDPHTTLARGIGAYGVLTGARTGTKLTYRFMVFDPVNYGKNQINNTSYTLSFGPSTTITHTIFTALRENILPPPDEYTDTATLILSF